MRARKRVVTSVDRAAPAWPTRRERRAPGSRGAPGSRSAATSQAGSGVQDLREGAGQGSVDAALACDLSVDLGRGLLLRNPVLVASGGMGYGVELDHAIVVEQLGAICTRGVTLRARTGNPPPRMARTPGGLLNGVGLQNPGLDAVLDRYADAWARRPVPMIVNLAADSTADFVELARRLEGVPGVAGLELNLSCPNRGRGGIPFALEADAAGAVTAAVRRATDLAMLVKLSPSASDPRTIARAVADAGADALAAINTLPGLVVDADLRAPRRGAVQGGLSGPAIRPVALRVVHEVAGAVSIPVVAMGGVTTIADVLDFLAVGAAAVGVATAALGDPGLPGGLSESLAAECQRRGLDSYRALIGTATTRCPGLSASRSAEYRL